MEGGSFNVRVVWAPATTPQGEAFGPALARAFGVDASIGERVLRECPVVVKRNVPQNIAEGLRDLLLRLGADAVIEPVAPSPSIAPAPQISLAPIARATPSVPAPAVVGLRASLAPPPSLRPPTTAVPPVQPPTPLLPPEKGAFSVSPLFVGLGVLLVVAAVLGLSGHWMARAGDEKMLGNTPLQETMCRGQFCLKGAPLADAYRAKRVLVVAWRDGCLGDDYRAFLEDLATNHHGEVQVVGAGLEVPPSSDPRAFGHPPKPPPDPWPPLRCAPRFDVLPIESYASDLLAAPATYLCDSDGSLIAAWRGGMAPEQRDRLRTWIEGRAWDDRGAH